MLICGLIATIITMLSALSAGEAIEDYLERRADFGVRTFLGRDPLLNPRLKMFIFDDQTVSMINRSELTLDDWGLIFTALAKTHPRHIIVDKLFAMPDGINNASDFNTKMAKLDVPVLTGGFVTPSAIPSRPELVLNQPWNHITSLTPDAQITEDYTWPSPPAAKLYAYGPNFNIASSLNHVGHIGYAGGGRVFPLIRLDERLILTHLSLLVADQLHISKGRLVVNNRELRLHNDMLQVNMPTRHDFIRRSYSMRALVVHARAHEEISVVNPDDEVLLLPAMATGSTDTVMTPIGELPGSYLVAGLINSVMNDLWLQDFGSPTLFIWLAALSGGACGLWLFKRRFWLSMGLGIALISGFGVLAFTYTGALVPWLYPSLTYLLTGVAIFAERTRTAQLAQVETERELATAGLVQRTFFPREGHQTPALTVVGHFQPVTQCGGDWWWHFSPSPGVDYVLIGDVMGHGMSSALVTALMYSALNTMTDLISTSRAGQWPTPVQVLKMLNKLLYNALGGEIIMTMFVGHFDSRAHVLTYANAGHRFPLFIPAKVAPSLAVHGRPKASKRGQTDIAITQLVQAGHVIGLLDDCVFAEQQMDLHPGDRFIFYTDGVLEHLTPEMKPWGQKAFLARTAELGKGTPQEIMDGLLVTLQANMAEAKQTDDYTLVIIEVPLTPGLAAAR